jgi:hypothetical protein
VEMSARGQPAIAMADAQLRAYRLAPSSHWPVVCRSDFHSPAVGASAAGSENGARPSCAGSSQGNPASGPAA